MSWTFTVYTSKTFLSNAIKIGKSSGWIKKHWRYFCSVQLKVSLLYRRCVCLVRVLRLRWVARVVTHIESHWWLRAFYVDATIIPSNTTQLEDEYFTEFLDHEKVKCQIDGCEKTCAHRKLWLHAFTFLHWSNQLTYHSSGKGFWSRAVRTVFCRHTSQKATLQWHEATRIISTAWMKLRLRKHEQDLMAAFEKPVERCKTHHPWSFCRQSDARRDPQRRHLCGSWTGKDRR